MAQYRTKLSARDVGVPTLLASASLNLVALITPLSLLMIFDRVIPFESQETLKLLALILPGVVGCEFLLRWCRIVMMSFQSEEIALKNYGLFIRKLVQKKANEIEENSETKGIEKIHAIASLRDFFSSPNQTFAIDLPFTLTFTVAVLLIGGWLVLVPLASIFAVFVFAIAMKRYQLQLFETRKGVDDRRFAFLNEVLSNLTTIKSNTMERQLTRRYEKLCSESVETSEGLIRFSGLAQSYGAIVAQCSVACTGLLGAHLVINGRIGIAEMAACMLLNGRVVQPILKLLSLWVQSEAIAAARAKLTDEDQSSANPQNSSAPIRAIEGHFELRCVNVQTPKGTPLFENASYTIKPGDIALVSANNPAIVDVFFGALQGDVEPVSGKILVDGRDAKGANFARGEGGLVTLERQPAMFAGTLLQNISAFGKPDAVERALSFSEALGLDRRVKRLPAGYNTKLGGNSSFEMDSINRHLIALVRVLALKPRVLLMFEPTVLLESRERSAFSACLGSLKDPPTIFVSTPDPRLCALADVVIDLSMGAEQDVERWLSDGYADAPSYTGQTRGVA